MPSELSPSPQQVTEADMIDLADGVLARDREEIVLAALKRDPRLGLVAKQFRADRIVLSGLGDVHAPAGLADGVQARLEAAALRGLSTASHQAPGSIPISSVWRAEPSALRLLLESTWTRRLATAASIAIVAGLAVLGVQAIRSGARFSHAGPIARTTPRDDAAPATPGAPGSTEEEVAVTPSPQPATPAATPAAPDKVAATTELTDARVLQLVREGRLAVTIHTPAAASAIKRLDARVRAREGWRSVAMDNVPSQYVALLTPMPATPMRAPDTAEPAPMAVASDSTGKPPENRVPATAPAALPVLRPVVKAMYTIELPSGDAAITALLRAVKDGLPADATVSIRELAQPAHAPLALDPESILWWNAPPDEWSKKSTVPVVVEGLE